jgi:dihydroorotate dehydrogenase (fumarate)
VKRISEILIDVRDWMEAHEYDAVEQLQGSMSQKNVAEPAAFERANYMKVLGSWKQEPTGYNPVTRHYNVPVSPPWRPQD